jgi:hypothetical protein
LYFGESEISWTGKKDGLGKSQAKATSVSGSGIFYRMLKVNVAPLPPELFSAHILPPCASTILFAINNPRPVPWSNFDANFENNLGSISGCIP